MLRVRHAGMKGEAMLRRRVDLHLCVDWSGLSQAYRRVNVDKESLEFLTINSMHLYTGLAMKTNKAWGEACACRVDRQAFSL